ncbi:MAG: LysE family translocator [Pseudomonadota bacterium]
MDAALFLAFLAATFVIVISPGPGVALASSQAVRSGPMAALATVLGDALGSAVHIIVVVLSLQALISVADRILPAIQILGGVYILYLAWRALKDRHTHVADTTPWQGYRDAFVAGFFSCVSNPKAIVFFAALFPGFISPNHDVLVQSLVYGVIFILLDAAFLMGYAMLALVATNSRFARRLDVNKLSAAGLFGVGALLVIKGYRDLRTQMSGQTIAE